MSNLIKPITLIVAAVVVLIVFFNVWSAPSIPLEENQDERIADEDDAASPFDETFDEQDEERKSNDGDEEHADSPVSSKYLGSYQITDAAFGTSVTVTVNEAAGTRTITANALPNHPTGEFPNSANPNTISAQSSSYTYPLVPTFTGAAIDAHVPGVALNGVKFEPGTAETFTCSSGETYRVEAIQDLVSLGLDFNNAHVQPTGAYHYHGQSSLLADAFDTGSDLVHVGFAADGHLMYYSKSGAYTPSYRLGSGARLGSGCTFSIPHQNVAFSSVKDGAITSDWEYVSGLGDLDACNGTTINGEYAYVLTEGFPYISRCLNGVAAQTGPGGGGSGGGQQGGPPNGGPPGGGPPPEGGPPPPQN